VRLASFAVFAVAILVCASAWAEPTKEDVARADSLFRDAQYLMGKASYPEACVAFAESQRLDPANGTLLNLALCHEKEGKTATAHRELKDLIALLGASRPRDDRERLRVASERLKSLEKKLSFVAFEPSSGMAFVLDGTTVDSAPIAVDLGSHTLVVSAPKKKPRSISFDVDAPGTKTIRIEPLADEAPPPAAPPPRPAPPPTFWTPGRIGGAALCGAGLIGIAIGAYFGIDTFDVREQRDARCVGTVCDAEGIRLHEDARSSATISTIGFAAGVVAIGVGSFLFVRARPQVDVGVGPQAVHLRGTF
jgi:hypothetical protein